MDPRWEKLGSLLVNYSTKVKKNERVIIAMTEPAVFPLALAVYRAVIKAGAYPQVQLLSEKFRREILTHGNDEQIAWVPELETHSTLWADVYIGLRGANNIFELQDISPQTLAKNQAAMGVVSTKRWENTRWCLIRVPSEALAQQAKMSYEVLEDMFFDSCFLDWENEDVQWRHWADILNKGDKIRITGDNTDLSFSVKGRTWIPFSGINNMPDGEIATAPITSTIDGTIFFERPGILGGRLIEGITLTWKDGVLVDYKSSSEQEYFASIIEKDSGSSLIGEFAFGTNKGVTHFSNDILLDEKILGTVHIALGRAYPECGGTNSSAIHWDIVKDLRDGGEVTLDGKAIIKDGVIVLPSIS